MNALKDVSAEVRAMKDKELAKENRVLDWDDEIEYSITKMILQKIASNDKVYLDEYEITDLKVFKTLYYLYKMQFKTLKDKQKNGISLAQKNGRYGRKKQIDVDILAFYDLLEKVKRKELTNRKAAELLGISIDKYYRIKKKLQNKNDTLLQLPIID